ncbi:MAG TPA: tripartite tricarboxylate transporter substrate binding protein [Candidatus Methylomirabilis sp.]|nr:tripartite tricarboxylate transporter substrate binding protein [Candidatus Methylomirabilis sp.]HSC70489.1 tripartite tricarboxylate transporter substrate binding protein [Candidatus Methylomirabilis sp.]
MRNGVGRLRVLLGGLASLLVVVGVDGLTMAQEKFPAQPIEVIVPTPPGGGTDTVTRILAEAAEPILGQKIVVVNKPGGSGSVGLNYIAKAKPDGYTLGGLWGAPVTMVPHVIKVSFSVDDFTYITQVGKYSSIFCVLSTFPAKTAKEFFEYAAKNPGKLTYANDGVGNSIHFSAERIFPVMQAKLRPVPYGGAGESIKALLGGHVDVYGGSPPPALPHIKAGTVRPLFVTTKERIELLPDVPGMTDLGHPELDTPIWRGILGPKGIPADRVAILERAFREAAKSPSFLQSMKDLGEFITATTGKEFEQMVKAEAATMAVIAKQIGLAPK